MQYYISAYVRALAPLNASNANQLIGINGVLFLNKYSINKKHPYKKNPLTHRSYIEHRDCACFTASQL